jgi:hypothetical protein
LNWSFPIYFTGFLKVDERMVSKNIVEMLKVVPSQKTEKKTCISATSPSTSPIRNFLGLNTGLVFDRS